MAKQLNLLSTGQVIATALHTEMQRSYLEYAMSVIVGRALPDVRDGLKPVHRRILYAMHELGLTPDRPYRKCARVVGDVLGKYHPHGDQSVYEALVRLVQDFSSRYPLLAGHGNFGSVDNDPPAAMRYTETRLSPMSHEAMLADIGEETVEFISNFDNSQQEPTVLPAQLPVLLLNGCAGIAVGMATNIPPHNLGEVVDGLIALIDQPELTEEKLLELVPGPDFPTGGEIVGIGGIKEAYTTGRGSIVLRGVAAIEEIPATKNTRRRTAIVVTELPYQVNKAAWIEKMAELVNGAKLEGISDIRDESDREGMRVVIELRRDANSYAVLQSLYQQTALQINFGAIMLAIVEGQPRQLNLRQLLQEFLKFREQTLNRRYSHQLEEAQGRIHIVEGLNQALARLDEVIDILRQAADGSTAKMGLQSLIGLSEIQADSVLAMPLRRLTGLEKQNLKAEFERLSAEITGLQRLLSDRRELLKALKKDLRTLKRKYGDERRTKFVNEQMLQAEKEKNQRLNAENAQKEEQGEKAIVEFTLRGYARRQVFGQKTAKKTNGTMDNDCVVQLIQANTKQDLVVLTSGGKVYPVKVGDVPLLSNRSLSGRGTPLINLLPNTTESVVSQFVLPDNEAQMVLLTKLGRIKRLALEDLAGLSSRGLMAIKFKDDDRLLTCRITGAGEDAVLATAAGRLLRFRVDDEQLPILGRTAMGLQALRLRKNEQLVGGVTGADAEENLLLFTQLGYAKQMPMRSLRRANRGDIGTQAISFTSKFDGVVSLVLAPTSALLAVTTNQRLLQLPASAISVTGKEGTGSRISELKGDEKIVSVNVLPLPSS
ncbi:DNA topoisomerase (ATP-hydrolyzing) subunit A [Synechocystis sp. PCC 7509]|uniref:DNA topoisomerase (ATP-hydrolyzing) subunit A n=1 Tax=Synechocystis sp. PCC 7509 TaxID=927677 RepID=UPI0002ACC980|nr:DNA topoisomerase (ATP-hydrolyzing) subunit A [Synechocystis sp. PCC 7509]